jgi:hypothetical protein
MRQAKALDGAMEAAKEYYELRERGDVVLAGEVRRLIEDLVGYWRDGVFTLPSCVKRAMRNGGA